jgi:protein SCO1/2
MPAMALAAAALGAVAAQLWLAPRSPIAFQSGTLLPAPRAIADFTLTGEDGKPFTNSALTGRWSLLFTGFTHCPDVCPTTLALLKSVVEGLGPAAHDLQVVFISVDPERDRTENLERYVHYFSPTFRGATGPVEQLEKLGANLGFVFAKVPGDISESYTMDHSAALILVNPRGELAGYITPPLRKDALVADLASVLASSS